MIGVVDRVTLHLEPPVQQIADFSIYFRSERHLSVSAIKGYRPSLALVLNMRNVDISTSWKVSKLIKSFE